MGKVTYRLVFQHDLTYAVEVKVRSGIETVTKGFADEATAEAWIAEQLRTAPEGEVWVRRLTLSWQ